jgi:hypothetical protein
MRHLRLAGYCDRPSGAVKSWFNIAERALATLKSDIRSHTSKARATKLAMSLVGTFETAARH